MNQQYIDYLNEVLIFDSGEINIRQGIDRNVYHQYLLGGIVAVLRAKFADRVELFPEYQKASRVWFKQQRKNFNRALTQ